MAYYVASVLLWLFLAFFAVWAWRPSLAEWLTAHPRARLLLLGTDRMPENARSTLFKFYGYLALGWTWLLAWSWWLMPASRNYFFSRVDSERAFQAARISTLVVLTAYTVFGFYCIGRALSLWWKKIYGPAGNSGRGPQ